MTISQKALSLSNDVAKMGKNVAQLLDAVRDGSLNLSLDDISSRIESAAQVAIANVLSSAEGLEISEIAGNLDVQNSFHEIKNNVRDYKFELEMFNSKHSLTDYLSVSGVKTIEGDESIDLSSTANLKIGESYVLKSLSGNTIEVTVDSIISATRFRATAPVELSMIDGTLSKTTWTIANEEAVGNIGSMYISKFLNVDPVNISGEQTRAVVIRQTVSNNPISLYFRDATHTSWTKAEWAWKRDTRKGFITDQYADDTMLDYEYIVPASGDFEMKLVANSNATYVKFIAVMTRQTNVKGTHHAPDAPTIISPVAGSTGIDGQAVLTVAEAIHPVYNSEIIRACFQISDTSGDFSNPILNEECTNGISMAISRGILQKSTQYFIRARVKDETGTYSAWSSESSFTTADAFYAIDTPSCLAPSANGEVLTADSLTFVSSDFSYDGDPDTHSASQWQLASDPLFASILHDSGTDITNLTSYDVPDGTISRGNNYYWRVRHQGASDGWSGWSASTGFTVREFTPFFGIYGTINENYCMFKDCVADGYGNLIVVGVENESGGNYISNAFIMKISHTGNIVWQRKLSGSDNMMFNGVDIDSSGNIYAVGQEEATESSKINAFIAKFTANGALVYQKKFGDDQSEYPERILIDESDNVYIVGYEVDAINANNGFLIKLDTSANISWQVNLGCAYYTRFFDVNVDTNGNVNVVGWDRASGSIAHAIIVQYNGSNGGINWQKKMNGEKQNYFYKIASDSSGDLYAVGTDLNSGVTYESMIFKISATDGSVIWKKTLGGSSSDYFEDIRIDAENNIYVAGHSMGNWLICKFTPAGTLTWQKQMAGAVSSDSLSCLALSPDKTIYVAGYTDIDMGVSAGTIGSFDAVLTGASGVFANATNYSWLDSSLTFADASMSLVNGAMTPGVTSFSMSNLSFSSGLTDLPFVISNY